MRSSRREFLRQAGQVGAACALTAEWLTGAAGASTGGLASQPASTLPALPDSIGSTAIDPSLKSVVADIRAREVVADLMIHETLLGEMLDEALLLAFGTVTGEEALRKLFKPDDIIGIKFNRIGERTINTTKVFAEQLVGRLKNAGFAPDRIMLIEVPSAVGKKLGTKTCPIGHAGPIVSFGSGKDQLAAWLAEVTAIINVPFLKTHNLAGMTCCLKNISHAVIRRPKLCHANGCSPFVGDIVALPQVRDKLRLHVVNALKAAFDGGPDPKPEQLWPHSGILVSTDPVATDWVGTEILNQERTRRNLPVIGDSDGHVGYVHAAAARGLGTDDQDYINWIRPTIF